VKRVLSWTEVIERGYLNAAGIASLVDGTYHSIDEFAARMPGSTTGYLIALLGSLKAGTTGGTGRDALLADKCAVVDYSPAVAR
jgi:hypothetical protein